MKTEAAGDGTGEKRGRAKGIRGHRATEGQTHSGDISFVVCIF